MIIVMARRYYYENNERFEAIGRIVLGFSILEELIRSSVGRLINDEFKVRQIITDILQFNDLLDLFDSTYRHKIKDKEKINELDDLLNRIHEASDKKNTILLPYRAGGDNHLYDSISFGYPRKGFGSKLLVLKADDLNDIADFIYSIATDISEFMLRTANSGELECS